MNTLKKSLTFLLVSALGSCGAKGKGKRGGARIIYQLIPQPGIIYLFYSYTKGDITDLSSDQKKRLRQAVEEIKNHFAK